MSKDDQFIFPSASKPRLTSESVTGADLKRYLILVFGTYRKASSVADISESRLHQIFMGYCVPENPDTIKRFANSWNVDIVVLVKIFDKLKEIGK